MLVNKIHFYDIFFKTFIYVKKISKLIDKFISTKDSYLRLE